MCSGFRSPLRQLEHQLRLLDDRLRRHHQHPGHDVVDRHDVEDQLRRHRQHVLPLERQVDQRRRRREALVPAAERDTRPRSRRSPAGRWRARCRSRAPPAGRPCSSCTCRCWASPTSPPAPSPAWSSRTRIHSLRARATASFSACSSSGSRFSSRSRSRACWRSDASTWASSASWRMRSAPAALSAISCSTEKRVPGSSLVAREIAVQLLVLPHLARPVARDEAGAGVDQRGAPHPLRERDDVLRPLDVGAQRRLERRVERHPARRVDEHVDVLGDLLAPAPRTSPGWAR